MPILNYTTTIAAIKTVGDYFRDLCLMFDCEVTTACDIGAIIAKGLVREFENPDRATVA